MSRMLGEELVRLAVALGRLAADPTSETWPDDPHAVMAARDSVVRGLAQTLSTTLAERDDLDTRPLGPALTLIRELRRLTRLEPSRGPLSAASLTGPDRPWAVACAAAVALEAHEAGIHSLAAPEAWSVVQDLARLARGVPAIDRDLLNRIELQRATHRRLPDSTGLQAWRSALAADVSTNRIGQVADQVVSRLTGLPASDGALTLTVEHDRPLIARNASEVPAALRRLTYLLNRADSIGIREVTLTSCALAHVARGASKAAPTATSSRLRRYEQACAALAVWRGALRSHIEVPHLQVQAESLGTIPLRPATLRHGRTLEQICELVGPAAVALAGAIERSRERESFLVFLEHARYHREKPYEWAPPDEPEEGAVERLSAAASKLRHVADGFGDDVGPGSATSFRRHLQATMCGPLDVHR